MRDKRQGRIRALFVLLYPFLLKTICKETFLLEQESFFLIEIKIFFDLTLLFMINSYYQEITKLIILVQILMNFIIAIILLFPSM